MIFLRRTIVFAFLIVVFSLFNPVAFAQGTLEVAAPDLNPPVITGVRFDNKAYFTGDIISSVPRIAAVISDEGKVATIEVRINSDVVYLDSPGGAYDPASRIFDYTLVEKQKLSPGSYVISIEAWDGAGNRSSAAFSDLKVVPNPPKLSGLNCSPNPFKPSDGELVSISYHLSAASEIRMLIYNMAGDMIWSREPKDGSIGAKRGFNNVSWDGRNKYGKIVLNGVYYLKFVSGNKVLGSAKIVVAD